MAKTILFITASLDGFIASKDGSVDWLYSDQDYDYTDFYESLDLVVMGRKTFEQTLTFGPYPYQNKNSLVFTSKPEELKPKAEGYDNIAFTSQSPLEFMGEASKGDQKIWLVGGGNLISQFIRNNLIDEFWIYLHPIILGKGLPLFQDLNKKQELQLIDTTPFSSGMVRLRYQKIKN
ncbi:MAG: dihydrofolate reductase family protein [SAR324 cluster bacterium]|nr:dihydrofolate reductase family protein [SAR324 cluster bacterium]